LEDLHRPARLIHDVSHHKVLQLGPPRGVDLVRVRIRARVRARASARAGARARASVRARVRARAWVRVRHEVSTMIATAGSSGSGAW
jgi:hypothetical protein